MIVKNWDNLPKSMKNAQVKPYYESLSNKKIELLIKRLLDVVLSIVLLVLLSPLMLIIGILISLDSKGGVFFRQDRVTQYGRNFKIIKFRTMEKDAYKTGPQVTTKNDKRVTKIGGFIRKYRIDEFPQLFNVLLGDMTFVGTRPEVQTYVDFYSPEMMATLLLPAGITSRASIEYKDEEKLLNKADDIDNTYIGLIMPEKMKYNLNYIKNFSLGKDFKIMVETLIRVAK